MNTDGFKNKPGIYQITCKVNGKLYIGSSKKLRQRLIDHRSYLRLNNHSNRYLQFAFNKYGESAFEFREVEYIVYSKESDDLERKRILLEREQYWIDKFEACKSGYNLTPIAGSPAGRKWTKEEKVRRLANKGPAWNKGIARTEEQNKHHSEMMQGRDAWNKGIPRREDLKLHQRERAPEKKPTLTLDKVTKEIVKRYDSLSDLSREIEVPRDMLSAMCHYYKKRKTFANSKKYKIDTYVVYEQDYLTNKI